MIQITKCPLCKDSRHKEIYEEFGFEISTCSHCGFIFTSKRFSFEEQEEWYNTNYKRYGEIRGRTGKPSYRELVVADFICDLCKKDEIKSVLDIGCGYGGFLAEMSKYNNIEVTGVELNSEQRNYLRKKEFRVYKDIEEIRKLGKKWDAIVLTHTLEHIPDPGGFIKGLIGVLNKHGYFVISVPNTQYTFLKLFFKVKTGRMGYFAPQEHLNHFSLKTLTSLFNGNRFVFYPIFKPSYKISKNLKRNLQSIYDKFVSRFIFAISGRRVNICTQIFLVVRKTDQNKKMIPDFKSNEKKQ